MNLVAIEIAEVIEQAIVTLLEENGEAGSMRFTRFIDLGGKQVELFLYPPQLGASVWCSIGIKSVYRTDEGDCVVYSAKIPSDDKAFEEVLVNPDRAKLPKMIERILGFLKEDLLRKASEKDAALEGGNLAIGSKEETRSEAESGEAAASESSPLGEISSDPEKADDSDDGKDDSAESESESDPDKEA